MSYDEALTHVLDGAIAHWVSNTNDRQLRLAIETLFDQQQVASKADRDAAIVAAWLAPQDGGSQ